ncbi:NRDE family protein [Halomonas denitrificans]|uniref:NRDE family protein n=1 Tax=Halomonas denitrificans TaxID=370769 RepID=UPI000D37A41B|nr:NRDE family protein [Halomonas denitrificans]
MCLIAFDHRPGSTCPLRLIANRDEFHARPTAPLGAWEAAPAIVGGRDLEAGGSWLAVHRRGRFAAVTNVRDPRLTVPPGSPSRGELVREALERDDLTAWLERLADGAARAYAGFNLLVGDGETLWHLHSGLDALRLRRVPPGLHGLSNASLDTPWPKLIAARQGLGRGLRYGRFPEDALPVLGDARPADDDTLPETGVGLERERQLSSCFIVGRDYGTRATSWLSWHADGLIEIGERRFGPLGIRLGESIERLTLHPQ